jgi:hypothetical protein
VPVRAEKNRDYLRRRYEACRAEQVCAWCHRDVPSGRALCTACPRKNSARNMARYYARKAAPLPSEPAGKTDIKLTR